MNNSNDNEPDRIFVSHEYRKIIEDWRNRGFFNNNTDQRIIWDMALAAGIGRPSEFKNKRDGLILNTSLATDDKIFYYAANIGENLKTDDQDNIDELTKWGNAVGYCEKCVNTGLAEMNELIKEYLGGKTILSDERREAIYLDAIDKLNKIYEDKVDSELD